MRLSFTRRECELLLQLVAARRVNPSSELEDIELEQLEERLAASAPQSPPRPPAGP